MRARPIVLVCALVVAAIVASDVPRAAGAAVTGPPKDLGLAGQWLWNFEALLDATYGLQTKFGHFVTRTRGPLNFDVNRGSSSCCSFNYVQIFVGAHGSAFHRVALRQPLLAGKGSNNDLLIPITVGGRYVKCAASKWLYAVDPKSLPYFWIACAR